MECGESYEEVEVQGLPEGVFTDEKDLKDEKDFPVKPAGAIRVFLFWAHKDEALKKQLGKHPLMIKIWLLNKSQKVFAETSKHGKESKCCHHQIG